MSYAFNHLKPIQEILERVPFGLITDVDGTISKTAPTPQQARVSPLCRHYLLKLSSHLALVAAISGRPVNQVRKMVGIDNMVYIGNHGMERGRGVKNEFPDITHDYSRVIKSMIKELTPLLSSEGISIEDKGVTATIHYRLSPEPQLAERKILNTLNASTRAKSLRVIRGKMSFNLLPPTETDKGTATMDLIREYNLQGGIYLGDDYTDIDAFKAIHTARHNRNFQGLAIGIISSETPEKLVTEADFTLNGVGDVEHFLKWMTENALQSSWPHPPTDTRAND